MYFQEVKIKEKLQIKNKVCLSMPFLKDDVITIYNRVHKMKGREDDNEDYYYLVAETKLHKHCFVCDDNNISSNM